MDGSWHAMAFESVKLSEFTFLFKNVFTAPPNAEHDAFLNPDEGLFEVSITCWPPTPKLTLLCRQAVDSKDVGSITTPTANASLTPVMVNSCVLRAGLPLFAGCALFSPNHPSQRQISQVSFPKSVGKAALKAMRMDDGNLSKVPRKEGFRF